MGQPDEQPRGYKLLLVPDEDIAGRNTDDPGWVVLSLTGPYYEVIADVGPDRKIRMSRLLYDQVEVAEPPG